MARDALEVLVGTGTMYIAPVGESYPANPTVSPSGNWEDPGYTTGGWTFAVDRTFEDIMAAEEIDRLRVMKTAQTISMNGEMMQASLENMLIAFGGGSIADDTPAAGYRTYTPPVSDDFDEYALLLRALAPPGDGTELRDFQIPRAIAAGAVEMPHAKGPDVTVVNVEFQALIPSAGSIFTIIEDKI